MHRTGFESRAVGLTRLVVGLVALVCQAVALGQTGAALGEVNSAPAPEHVSLLTHVQQGGRPPDAKAGPVAEKVVYQNAAADQVVRFGAAHQTLADDLNTNAFSGCQLTRYQVRVNGGAFGGGRGTFGCDVELLDGCPGSGGVPIVGTAAHFAGLDDDAALMHDLVVDVSAAPVAIPAGVWISVSCDSSEAGVVYGTAPTIGQSDNRYFADDNGCATSVAPPAYAAMHVELFVDDSAGNSCDSGFVAYSAAGAAAQNLSVGAGQRAADDFTTALAPTGESCLLAGYDVYMRGTSGPYVMQLDLRHPYTDVPIADTAFTYFGKGDGGLEVARLVVPGNQSISITPAPLWISWQADKGQTGPVNNVESIIGFSEDEFFFRFLLPGPPFFAPQLSFPRAAISMVVYCRGEEPRGACCGNQIAAPGQSAQCLDDVSVSQCKDPAQGGDSDARWLKDRTCAQNAFDPPCGTHGCCTPSNCMDTTYDACVGVIDPTSFGLPCTDDAHCPGRTCEPDGFCSPRTGVWTLGEFCDPELPIGIPFDCPYYSCHFAQGSCLNEEEEVDCCTAANNNCNPNLCPMGSKCQPQFGVCTPRGGCNDVACCDRICGQDSFCCSVMWDNACVNQTQSNCRIAPSNDVCADDNSLERGARTIPIFALGPGTFQGLLIDANNSFATAAATDPSVCCNKYGPELPIEGTIWFKFVMPFASTPSLQPTTARINTCATPGSDTAIDPILAVYAVGDATNETSSCGTLIPIGCGDDQPSCGSGQQADICVSDLTPGQTYYIMLGSANSSNLGPYKLSVGIPCGLAVPPNDTCGNSPVLPPGPTTTIPFNLANATQDCPDEVCAYRMQSDVWYEYIAPCTGVTTFETCNPIAQGADPQTTLVVYEISNLNDTCDLDSADILGCNDDAPVNATEHLRRPQSCKFSGVACDDSGDCQRRCTVDGAVCTTAADCSSNQICAVEPCVSSCGAGSAVTVPTVSGQLLKVRLGGEIGSQPSGTLTVSCGILDCNGNGIPDPQDVAAGTATDCDADNVLDGCEIANAPALDCNGNGTLDVCEIAAGSAAPGGPFFCTGDCQPDCDGNGRIDACDIAGCAVNQQDCADCNGNLVPDGCEVAGGIPLYGDDDGDGTVNCVDLCPGLDDGLFAPGCVSAIPTVSGWGSVVLVLLLLVGAKVYFGGGGKRMGNCE